MSDASDSIHLQRALISVYDKTGIVDFARALHAEFGVELISTGGTAALLRENDIPVTLVEDVTGFPEMMDGRVKTLHPKIHAAILADRNNPEHMRQLAEQGIRPIDMVVVNLYPFARAVADPEMKLDQELEMIDIGGPCLLRAAAKNFNHVVAVSDPDQYESVLEELRERNGGCHFFESLVHAIRVFQTTSRYDLAIYRHFSEFVEFVMHRMREPGEEDASTTPIPAHAILTPVRERMLRYGENPHQEGSLWRLADTSGLLGADYEETGEANLIDAQQIGGDEMSFNNYADADAALSLCKELTYAFREVEEKPQRPHKGKAGAAANDDDEPEVKALPACVFVKHQNPCGVGVANDALKAYRRAYLGDPLAALGGVLAVNFPVVPQFAERVMTSLDRWGREAGATAFFIEVWVAPEFDEQAVQLIRQAKAWGRRCRLLAVGPMTAPPDPNEVDLRKITGGMLLQQRDYLALDEREWKVVTKRQPTRDESDDLRLAWLIGKHTKSNAITIVRDGTLLGCGAGQMSRVMSCRIAVELAARHLKRPDGADEPRFSPAESAAVAASDAFFPFRDGPDALLQGGVRAIIQPGGSKRDDETIAACDEQDATMIFTGQRHFKH